MELQQGNLFADSAPPAQGERFESLLRLRGLHLERIVSSAQPEPGEYCQEQDEWVVLLRGEALLEVAGQRRALAAGDYVFLPARTPHRVLSTSAGALWLAAHLAPGG